eukprot:scaffold16355_cov170-Amphora_coffeaeformis.AAC.2
MVWIKDEPCALKRIVSLVEARATVRQKIVQKFPHDPESVVAPTKSPLQQLISANFVGRNDFGNNNHNKGGRENSFEI